MAMLWKYLFFLCLCVGGFCCNSGWYAYMGKCYKASQNMYTSQMAKRFCQVMAGHLVYVNSTDILRFINTIPNFNGIHDYWVRDGSSISESSTAASMTSDDHEHEHEHDHGDMNSTDHDHDDHSHSVTSKYQDLCPYVKILTLDVEYCTEKKFFVCESLYPDNPDICPAGFDYYGSHCYRPISSAPANYDDAAKFCILQNSKLATLETEDKEWEAKSALLGKNETYLVSARRYDGVLKWDNETIFDPFHDIFGNYSEDDCVGFLSQPEHPLIFSWSHVKCEDKNSFLCEVDPLPPKETETTTIAKVETTPGPLQCPHGYNWKSHDISGYCYWETTYETERLNWFQARNFCKRYGGDLASYDNEEQESIGLGGARGHYRGLWIGLKKDENSVFHWVDGNTLSFTNWDYNEPNTNSKTKFCVTHSSGSSKWALDYCGVRRWFICKAPKARNAVVPEVPVQEKTRCDIQGVSIYRTQWYEFEGHCYLIQDVNKYTWDTGRLFCQDNEAHLASFHSFEETDFILSTMSSYPASDFWIGLSSHGLHSSYEWMDNTALDFIYWSDNKTEPKDFNTCVIFNKRDGSWDNDNCNRLQGVICKRGINSSYDFASTEPTIVMPGNCENGWYNLGNKCYKFFGSLWSQRLTWNLAKTECENLGATLVSIHNQDEQDFLTDIVLEADTAAWIGLRAMEGGTVFHWSDDTRMDFTNWNVNEPEYHSEMNPYLGSRPVELCVEMMYGENSMGKWNDIHCESKAGYICQKRKDPTNTEPYHDPFNCLNITGWYRLGSACYGFFEQQNMTWLEAQGECKTYGANLITYKNTAVSIFVKRKLKRKDAQFWIGIREKMLNTYEYVTGQPLFYTNWRVGQPHSASVLLDNCVATTADGEWLVKSCKEKHPFICKVNRDAEPEPEIDRSHTCRNLSEDWFDFGGNYCYLLQTDIRLTWVDAMHYCFKHGGYLASFHSADEIMQVRRNVLNYDKPYLLHIGLGRRKDGSFSWVDNSAVDFLNWDVEEPDSIINECVEMNMRTGKWNAIECDDNFRGFICSSPKPSMYFEEPQPLNTTSTSDSDVISKKLTSAGIFGIVVCILVIFAVIGMIVYYLRPTKEVQPRLLETDNL